MIKPYYQDEWVTIYCGDCREILPELPTVDLVLTDPPYGIGADKGTFFTNPSGVKRGFTPLRKYEAGNWDNSIPSGECFASIFNISQNQVIFGGNYFTKYLPPSRCWVFWHKKVNPTQGKNFADGELIWTSFDRNTIYKQFGWLGLDQINHRGEIAKLHPTMKPTELICWLLLEFSSDSDTILDPFLGSGTTAYCAKKLNRKCIGIEIEEKYCEIAAKRCSQGVFNLGQ